MTRTYDLTSDTCTFPKVRAFTEGELEGLAKLGDKVDAFYGEKLRALREARDAAVVQLHETASQETPEAKGAFADADAALYNAQAECSQAHMQLGYEAGQVAGFRLGFQLAFRMENHLISRLFGAGDRNFAGHVAVAMYDDDTALDVIQCLLEKGDPPGEPEEKPMLEPQRTVHLTARVRIPNS